VLGCYASGGLLVEADSKGWTLDGGEERAIARDVAVGHARRVEGEGGVALAVEEDEAAGALSALGEEVDGVAGGEIGGGIVAGLGAGSGVKARGGAAQEIGGGFGHDDFHDGFAVPGTGNSTGFGIGVAATADERRVADAAGKFATGSAGRRGGEEVAVTVECNGADGALLVAAVMLGGVFIFFAFHPGFPLGFADHFLGLAQFDAVFNGEALRAIGDEHHVRAVLENFARELDGILDAMQVGGGAGAKRGAVHHDGVAFDVPVEIEMRAVAGIEGGIILENHDGGFDGVQSGAAKRKNGPAGGERAAAAGVAGFDGVVGNVPRAAVNDKRWFHRDENGKRPAVCRGQPRS
jgi:hypothetical protein